VLDDKVLSAFLSIGGLVVGALALILAT